jgi:hypothetical protein
MRFQGSEGLESLVQFWVSGHFVSLIDNAIIEVESNNLEISSGNEPEQRQRTFRVQTGGVQTNKAREAELRTH